MNKEDLKEELIEKIIKQIITDVEDDNYEVIEEMISLVMDEFNIKYFIGYLSGEDNANKYKDLSII